MEQSKLKVLMIGTDRKLFESGSAVSERIKEYGALVQELHVIVLCDKKHGLKDKKLGENVWLYSSNSSNRFLRPIDAARMGKKLVLKNKFVRGQSLVTAQDPFECGWVGLKVKNKWRLPLEIQLHTDPFSPYFSGFLNSIRKQIARKVLKHADSIRVVSENLKQSIGNKLEIENWKLKIYSLPIYVDKEKIENAPILFDIHTLYPWHFTILMVCRLEKEKNIDLALEVLALVRSRFPETGLLIVGEGSEKNNLLQKVKRLKLETGVEFAGWQSELASYYKTANAFLQTSSFEGYGLALVEAGLSGLPVITTPVGIATELEHGKDAYIYPATEPENMAQGIIDLIENNQKREYLRLNLKQTLESKLLIKEDYLAKIGGNWLETSKRIS